MHFRKNVFSIFAATIVLTAFCASQSAAEEEKSLWQRFVDWFKPAPTLEGEGPLYDELRELDVKIDRTEGRYSRERRPGNKTRLKKELEDLNKRFDKCVEAYYSVDCGDHWVVSKATDVKRKYGTFKVQKGTFLIVR